MKLFKKGKDGGSESTVTGYWLIEVKQLFSVVLLRFEKGSRDAYHNHSFNALSWWCYGEVEEHLLNGQVKTWKPSLFPKYTPRRCFHKVVAKKHTWCLSFRGPWSSTWNEFIPSTKSFKTLSEGRKIVYEKR